MPNAVVLTWNPGHVLGRNLDPGELLEKIREQGSLETPWLCRDKAVRKGTAVFLLKKSLEPMGIMACGRTTSDTYAAGENEQFDSWVDVSFTEAVDVDSVLPVRDLQSSHYDGAPWRNATKKYPAGQPGWGGVLDDEVAARVAKVWAGHFKYWNSSRARAVSSRDRQPEPVQKAAPLKEMSTANPEKLELQVSALYRGGDVPRPSGTMKPRSTLVERREFQRNANVVAHVLLRSRGNCEFCSQKAPFTRADGVPYLEVHHVKRLADGGPDCIENAVALCPNCHRRLHFGARTSEDQEVLFSTVKILRRF